MYTYAFLPSSSDALTLPTGIVGSLQLITVEQISALVEPELLIDDPQLNDHRLVQAVIAHDAILRSLFEQTPILPLRFGTRFISEQALIDHLTTHQTEYQNQLAALSGKAEYTLKCVLPELPSASPDTDSTGKAYFLAKKQRYQAQADYKLQQQSELHELIDMLGQNSSNLVHAEPQDGVERIYILGDRHQELALQQQLQAWKAQHPQWSLTLGEALPPYHFV